MMSTRRTGGCIALVLSLCAAARADAPPPSTPTMFLAVDAPSLRGQSTALAGALKAALPQAARSFSVVVVGSDASSPLPVKQRDEIADALTNRSAHSSPLSSVLFRAVDNWQGGKDLRHHLIVLTGPAPELSRVSASLGSATREGFTVSFICLGKVDAKARKELLRYGAGRVWAASTKTLAGALRSELSWAKLSKGQERARQAAVDAYGKDRISSLQGSAGGVLGVLRGSGSGGIVNVLGAGGGGAVGGLGLRGAGTGGGGGYRVSGVIGRLGGSGGYSPSNQRLRRAESLVGGKLALTFRQVSGGSDVAETRRALLGAAKPLLSCLEGQLSLSGRDEITVEFVVGGKATGANTAAAKCVETWMSKLPRGQRATLLVGPASAAQ